MGDLLTSEPATAATAKVFSTIVVVVVVVAAAIGEVVDEAGATW